MKTRIVTVSNRPDDLAFAQALAKANGYDFHQAANEAELREQLPTGSHGLLIVDAEDAEGWQKIAPQITDLSPTLHAFIICDQQSTGQSYIPHFRSAHHLYRRIDEPAQCLYIKLAAAALTEEPYEMSDLFPAGSPGKKLTLRRSGEKSTAIETIERELNSLNLVSRLSTLAAQAVDELIMNAIFDAPSDDTGKFYRRGIERAKDFPLSDREQVDVQVLVCDQYIGVCVTDRFGTLKRDTILGFIGHDYRKEDYKVREDDLGAGLGLHGIVHGGLSVCFSSRPAVKTDVMLFFPRVETYKAFRQAFRFMGVRTG